MGLAGSEVSHHCLFGAYLTERYLSDPPGIPRIIPFFRGEIAIRIAANGNWYHEGRRFQRASLVRLFTSILRREQNECFLVTPAGRLLLEVEDTPFVATPTEQIDENGQHAIVLATNIGERIAVDRDQPIRAEIDEDTPQPRPCVLLHDGHEALINRSAFHDLINLAEETERDGAGYLSTTTLGETLEPGSTNEQRHA